MCDTEKLIENEEIMASDGPVVHINGVILDIYHYTKLASPRSSKSGAELLVAAQQNDNNDKAWKIALIFITIVIVIGILIIPIALIQLTSPPSSTNQVSQQPSFDDYENETRVPDNVVWKPPLDIWNWLNKTDNTTGVR
jgi:hypothetical protein